MSGPSRVGIAAASVGYTGRPGSAAKIASAIAEAKTALNGSDIGAIKSAMEKLGTESQALGQAIYESAQAEQAASGGGSSSSGADDVVDAEVVEDDQEPR